MRLSFRIFGKSACFCILTALLCTQTVHAQDDQLFAIGDGSLYQCAIEEDSFSYLVKVRRSEAVFVRFGSHIRKAKRNVRRYSKKLKRVQRRGNQTKIEKFTELVNTWQGILTGMLDCRKGQVNSETKLTPELEPTSPPVVSKPQAPSSPGTSNPGSGTAVNSSSACGIIGAEAGTRKAVVPENRFGIERIINGEVCSSTSDSPIVMLNMRNNQGFPMGACTGTAVTSRVVVTAAHCLADNGITEVQVQTAMGNYTSRNFASHSSFSMMNLELELNDIAVVILSQDMAVKTFSILPDASVAVGETVVIAGYGLTENNQAEGLRAGKMTLSSVSAEAIIANYDGRNGSNSCNGDSGGPLLVKRGETWFLAGVTSNGDNLTCGMKGDSDVSRWSNITSASNRAFLLQKAGLS